jgi:hypothetical protein
VGEQEPERVLREQGQVHLGEPPRSPSTPGHARLYTYRFRRGKVTLEALYLHPGFVSRLLQRMVIQSQSTSISYCRPTFRAAASLGLRFSARRADSNRWNHIVSVA